MMDFLRYASWGELVTAGTTIAMSLRCTLFLGALIVRTIRFHLDPDP